MKCKCIQCGTRNAAGDEYCLYCGLRLVDDRALTGPQQCCPEDSGSPVGVMSGVEILEQGRRRRYARTWRVTDDRGSFELSYDGYGAGYETVAIDGVEVARRKGLGGMSQRFEIDHFGRRIFLTVALPWWRLAVLLGKLAYVCVELDGRVVYEEGQAPRRLLRVTRGVAQPDVFRRALQPRSTRPSTEFLARGVALTLGTIAAVGLILSIVVHGSTFFGVDPMDVCPAAWGLHILAMAVCIAAFMWAGTGKPRRESNARDSFDAHWPYAPRWMSRLAGVFFFYAIINFGIFFALSANGTPERRPDGTFALESHGKELRVVDEAEFHRGQARVMRGFSGHWMLFHCVAMCMHISRFRKPGEIYVV